MRKVIIGICSFLVVLVSVILVIVILHRRNTPEFVEPEVTTAAVQQEITDIIETVEAIESTSQEIGNYSMESAVGSMVSYILSNEILSQYFTKEDIKVKVRGTDTVIYLDNCTKTGYDLKELDMFIIPATGEPYDTDDVLDMLHWLMEHSVQETVVENPEDPSRADFFNEGNSEAEAGWKKIDLYIFGNVEEWSEFDDASVEEWFNPDFLYVIKSRTGSYDVLLQLTNFLNMDSPFIGDKWRVTLDDPQSDDLWGIITTNRGGIPYKYRMHLNINTEEFEMFEEE